MESLAISDRPVFDAPPLSLLKPRAVPACAEEAGPVLHVVCFGGFRVSGAAGWRPGPQAKRGRELIQFLALNSKRAVSRERLTSLFWPEIDADAVQHRLHIAASGARAFLREVLGGFDAIRCTSEGYAWHPAMHVTCDVPQFANLYREGSAGALQGAVALYGGELLEGEEADWLQPSRVKYATMYASILERLAETALVENEFEIALNYGLELLAIDRAHEGASRLVMRCFAAIGRRAKALEEYETLQAYLRKHLAIDPMPETKSLIRSIMACNSGLPLRQELERSELTANASGRG